MQTPDRPPACPQVNFNEPLSMLQRLTEDLEYHRLLDAAARCSSAVEQMCLVAAFSVSSYSTTVHRIAKPFNPMLGETFELDRLDDMGLRSLCEQVRPTPAPARPGVRVRQTGHGLTSGPSGQGPVRRLGLPWDAGSLGWGTWEERWGEEAPEQWGRGVCRGLSGSRGARAAGVSAELKACAPWAAVSDGRGWG